MMAGLLRLLVLILLLNLKLDGMERHFNANVIGLQEQVQTGNVVRKEYQQFAQAHVMHAQHVLTLL